MGVKLSPVQSNPVETFNVGYDSGQSYVKFCMQYLWLGKRKVSICSCSIATSSQTVDFIRTVREGHFLITTSEELKNTSFCS